MCIIVFHKLHVENKAIIDDSLFSCSEFCYTSVSHLNVKLGLLTDLIQNYFKIFCYFTSAIFIAIYVRVMFLFVKFFKIL